MGGGSRERKGPGDGVIQLKREYIIEIFQVQTQIQAELANKK